MIRRASLAKRRTVGWLAFAAKHPPAQAFALSFGLQRNRPETIFGIHVGKRPGQAETAFRNLADAAPASWHHAEHFLYRRLCRSVALAPHRTAVLVFHLCAPLFQLSYTTVDALENIERLEPGDDNW